MICSKSAPSCLLNQILAGLGCIREMWSDYLSIGGSGIESARGILLRLAMQVNKDDALEPTDGAKKQETTKEHVEAKHVPDPDGAAPWSRTMIEATCGCTLFICCAVAWTALGQKDA